MKKTALSLAIAAIISSPLVNASSVEDRLAAMEQRINQLEQRVASQDAVIQEKEQQIEELQSGAGQQASASGGWADRVSVGGVVEVEANHVSTGGSDTSDLYVATAELDISAQVNNWTTADVVLLWEDGDSGVNLDTATITIADPDNIWAVTAGKTVVPFGVFAANTLSDPLTLELAETSEDAIIAGIESNGWTAGAYTYAGGRDDIGSYGLYAGFGQEIDNLAYAFSVGYTNSLEDADTLDAAGSSAHIDAWYASLELTSGPFGLNAEYVAANDDFATTVFGSTAPVSPSAYYIEGAYNFSLAGKESVFAIGYSNSDESDEIGLAEKRIATALSIGIMDNTALSFEYANEEAYDGTDTDKVNGQLAVEF